MPLRVDARPFEVVERLRSLGFKPLKGYHDHVYDWGRKVDLEDILQLANDVHETLKGLRVLYKLEKRELIHLKQRAHTGHMVVQISKVIQKAILGGSIKKHELQKLIPTFATNSQYQKESSLSKSKYPKTVALASSLLCLRKLE